MSGPYSAAPSCRTRPTSRRAPARPRPSATSGPARRASRRRATRRRTRPASSRLTSQSPVLAVLAAKCPCPDTFALSSFVELCSEEGLATVTGTIEVGASTKAQPRSPSTTVVEASSTASTSLPASVTATASLATYNPNSAPASTATVPSLVASGSIASSARAAAASETPVNNKTSGAVGAVSVRSALAGVVALAAGLSLLA